MTLAETQTAFFGLVTDPGRVEEKSDLQLFCGTATLPVEERLRIYANMYLWRLVDALRNDFPKLAVLVGDDRFFELSSKYLVQHPSEHPDVGQVGRHLVRFLREHPEPTRRPDLADLAQLEHARAQVFLEADSRTIDASAVSELGGAFSRARLRLVPALELHRFEYLVAPLWRSIEEQQTPPPPVAQPNQMAIWRKEFAVYHVVLEADEAEALRLAISGAPLDQVCAAFAAHGSPAQAAFAALSSWFVEGWVAALDVDPD